MMNWRTGLLVLSLVMGLSTWGFAKEIVITTADQQGVDVTIYNDNLALIKDRRKVSLPGGVQTIAFRDISAQMIPETALVRGGSWNILEQNFAYDLLSPTALLQKYVGKEVQVIYTNPLTGEERMETAKVLSAEQGPVLQIGDRIETTVHGRLVYPNVPANLRDRPTLSMLLDNNGPQQGRMELSYQTTGLSWKSDYVAELNPGEDQLALNGWVTLINESGTRYPHARLQLIAGDVHQVRDALPEILAKSSAEPGRVRAVLAGASEESMLDYHLYTLPRPTTLEHNQKKQVSLLHASQVQCRKEYLLQGQRYYYRTYDQPQDENKSKVGVYIEVENRKAAGLGMPLPRGVVRVYKKDSRGMLQFVGEDQIDHTSENEVIRLHIGEAFDLTAERRQTAYKKSSWPSPFSSLFETSFAIKLKNAKEETVLVTVREPIPGDWEVVSSSLPHTKESAHTVLWQVEVPAKGTTTLTYTVRVKL